MSLLHGVGGTSKKGVNEDGQLETSTTSTLSMKVSGGTACERCN